MDRLTSLTVFGQVVESGGFSAAARRLNMSVTMVSNHIQSLEDRLGARLLNRTTRKVSLTETGKAYYERSRQILMDLEEADRIADALQSTPRGTLRLHTNTTLVRFLMPVIDEFLTLHTGVSLDLTTGERMVDMVEEGYDLAVRAVPPPDSSLIVRRLTPWRHILCCAPGYLETHAAPVRPADLAKHNCLRYVYYPFGDEWRFEGPDGETISVRVGGTAVSNSAEMLRFLVLNSQGVMLAPSFVVMAELESGRLVRLMPDYHPVQLSINAVYPNRQHLSTKVRCFLDLLAERFVEHRRWMDPDQPG